MLRGVLIVLLLLFNSCPMHNPHQDIFDDLKEALGLPEDAEIGKYSDLPEYMEFYEVSDVQDAPLWQLVETEPVMVELREFTEFDIPNLDEWQSSFAHLWPLFVEKENDSLILYGMHITKPPLISAIVDFCKVDGVNRWQLGSMRIETFYFDYDYDATMNWFFGANIPGNPGPEYVKIEFFYKNNDKWTGRVIERAVYVYGVHGSTVAELHNLQAMRGISVLPGLPLEYPNTSTFRYLDGNSPIFYRIVDLSDEPESNVLQIQLSNMGQPNLTYWFAESSEWIAGYQDRETGEWVRAVVMSDGSETVINMDEWPHWPGGDETQLWFNIPVILPFHYGGHRFFLAKAYLISQDGINQKETHWCVQFDPGSTEIFPIWCREEPRMAHSQDQVIILGDNHPYWVRFSPHCKKMRVIDLLSGYAVLEVDVEILPMRRGELYVVLVNKLKEHWDIPSILLFDPDRGILSKYDLDLVMK